MSENTEPGAGLTANVNLPLGSSPKWADLVKFVELGEALGMQPTDDVFVDVDERTDKLNGLTIYIDPTLIEYRTP